MRDKETSVVEVVKYSSKYKPVWDAFVAESKNGTFLLCRGYMEYHADRFTDCSLLFYHKGKLLALLPANEEGEEVHSHGGLSYGGFVTNKRMKATLMLEVVQAMQSFYLEQGFAGIKYKAVPHIYHKSPAEEDLYALFRNGATLYRRDVNSVVMLQNQVPYASLRKRRLKKASPMELSQSHLYDGFMQLGKEMLQERHNTLPAHTTEEIKLLATRFPENIKLFTATKSGELLAGVLIYETATVAHCQYIASSENGREVGALDVLIDWLLKEVYPHKVYFSFGVSTEQQGQYLNKGLIQNKESYGARAVMHDFYELRFRAK